MSGESDLYKLDLNRIDIMAVSQNLGCEVRRIMGIFPNCQNLSWDEDGAAQG